MSNYFNILLTFVAIGVCVWAGPSPALGDSKLIELMRSTRDVQKSNPTLALECFNYYTEKFDEYLKKYESDYAACVNMSSQQIEALNWLYVADLGILSSTAQNACERLNSCYNDKNVLDSFNCYSHNANDNVKVMYNISSDASNYYAEMLLRHQVVKFDEEQCINSSRLSYERYTGGAYNDFQNCLLGVTPVPASTVTTKKPTTTVYNPTAGTRKTTIQSSDIMSISSVKPTEGTSRINDFQGLLNRLKQIHV